jgi:carbon monoxide dehydrogenase subunit G
MYGASLVRRVTVAIEIAGPVQPVWDLLMDPARLGEWVTIHRTLEEVPETPLSDSAALLQTLELRGRSFDVRWRLVETHEPHLARWEGEGPAGSDANVTYHLDATGTGSTRLEYSNAFHLPGGLRGRLASRMLKGDIAEREARESLQRLKQLVEQAELGAGSAGTAPPQSLS